MSDIYDPFRTMVPPARDWPTENAQLRARVAELESLCLSRGLEISDMT